MNYLDNSSARLRKGCAFVMSVVLILSFSALETHHAQSAAGLSYVPVLNIGRGMMYKTAWQPNGDKIAVASATGIWFYTGDFQDSGHIESTDVAKMAWSPDGRTLAVLTTQGCTPNTCNNHLIFWDAQMLQQRPVQTTPQASFSEIAWSPDGTLFAGLAYGVGGSERLLVWNIKSGQIVRDMLHPAADYHASYTALEWSPDSKRVAALSEYHVDLIAIATEHITVSLATTPQLADFSKMAWSPDGRQLATLMISNPAKVWDTQTGAVLQTLPAETTSGTALAWEPSGKRLLLSVGGNLKLYTWTAATSATVTLTIGSDHMYTLHWHGNLVWGMDYNFLTITQWDARNGQIRAILHAHENVYRGLTWSPDSSRIATINTAYQITIWDAHSGHALLVIPPVPGVALFEPGFPPPFLAWSPDGTRLVSVDNVVHLWNAVTGQLVRTLPNSGIALWSHDGKRLATGKASVNSQRDSPSTVIIDATTGETVVQLPNISQRLRSWSSDDKYITTSTADAVDFPGYTYIWDAQNGSLLLTLDARPDAQFSPDNHWLASVNTAWLQIREPTTGIAILNIATHANTLAWHPTGSRVASDDPQTGALNIWDTHTGQFLSAIANANSDGVFAWSPDGQQIASISAGTLRTWQETGSAPLSPALSVPSNVSALTTASTVVKHVPPLQATMPTIAPTVRHSLFVHALVYKPVPAGQQIRLSRDGKFFAITPKPTNGDPLPPQMVDVYRVDDTDNANGAERRFSFVTQSWEWSPDGQLIVSLAGNQAYLIKTATGTHTLILVPPASGSTFDQDVILWSPDSRYVSVQSKTRRYVLSTLTASLLITLPLAAANTQINQMAWSPDSTLLAASSGTETNGVVLWDVPHNRLIGTLSGIGTTSANLGWSPDSHHLATIGADTVLSVWNIDVPTKPVFNVWNVSLSGVVWSHNSQRLAVEVDRATVRVWDLSSAHVIATVRGHNVQMRQELWSPDDRLLFTQSEDRGIGGGASILWDVDADVLVTHFELPGFNDRWLSNDALLLMSEGGPMVLWQRGDPQLQTITIPDVGSLYGFGVIAIDGELFSTSIKAPTPGKVDQSALIIRRFPTGEPLAELDHGGAISDLQITPDGHIVLTTDESNMFTVWQIRSAVEF